MRAPSSLLLALLLLVPAGALAKGLPAGSIMTVGKAASHSLSQPLRNMTVCPAAVAPTPPPPGHGPFSSPIADFEGTNLAGITGGGCSLNGFASDDSGAIGRRYFVQVVNVAVAVYDRAGHLVAGPVATSTFWSNQPDCGGSQVWSDSVVIYDQRADRWVMSRPGGLPKGADLCLAVSRTSDPTGRWDEYAFKVNNATNGLAGYFNDYAKISAWPGSYFATADPNKIFSGVGNTISAFDRAAMLRGDPAPSFVTFFVPAPPPVGGVPSHSHMLSAALAGTRPPPRDAPGYIVQVQDAHLGFPADRLQIYEFRVNWKHPAAASLTPTASLVPQPFNSNACPAQSCIAQPAGPPLDSLSYGYMMQRLVYRNFRGHQVLLLNHTVAANGNPGQDHAGIRWYELRKTRGHPWSLYQQGTYAPDSNNRWLGSIAMDRRGDIVLGFDVAGPSKYASIHYAGRRPGDPPGALPRGEYAIVEGKGAQLGKIFFGDYSQMTVDPRDDCTFWYTNTYYPSTSAQNLWHTRIASLRFRHCRR
jgi:hypothetical protein